MISLRRALRSLFLPLFAIAPVCLSIAACTGTYALTERRIGAPSAVTWFTPVAATDRTALDRWAAAVGPPVVVSGTNPGGLLSERTLCVVSWNTALGEGDVTGFLTDLRRADPDVELVLLLQEVYRRGSEVPAILQPRAAFPGKLGRDVSGSRREEIEAVAARWGLNLYYVPSMRNGSPAVSDEDRGNAILSTLPLKSLGAIELPFERQRRVAVAATIVGGAPGKVPWQLRVVSAHLDNLVGARRGWFAGAQFGRIRQARALVEYLRNEDAVVVGGDLNTWFGFREGVYAEMLKAFPGTRVDDRRPTFRGLLRLDHVFFRLPAGWRSEFRRGGSTYGSDHYPLIATIALP